MESEGYSLVAVRGPPIAVTSLVETGCRCPGCQALELSPSGCGAWAQLFGGMWDLPGSGIKPHGQANSSPLSH